MKDIMFMQKTFNIIIKTALAIVLTAIATGCMTDKLDTPKKVKSVMIELSVLSEGMTKAIEEAPTASEDVINSLYIYAFHGERLAGYLSRGTVSQGEYFYMDLQLPSTGTFDVEFYVIANVEQMAYENGTISLSEDMTRAQLEALKFTGLTSVAALPMYCKKVEEINVSEVSSETNTTDGHDGHMMLTKKVEFDLTRSLAKISLYAAKEQGASAAPQILNAKILAPGTRTYSYLFPQLEQTLNEVTSRPNDRILLSSGVNVDAEVVKGEETPAEYDLIFDDAYIPEVTYGSDNWSTSSGNDREVVLRVEYALSKGGEVRTGFIYMPQITRNTYYKVLLLISAEGQLIINYEVLPWENNTISEISFDYPTHSYLRESIPATEAEIAEKPSMQAQMSETKPFEGYFQMTYPDTDSWTPTLMGPPAGNCDVTVYDMSGLTPTIVPESEWPIKASEKWYKVVVDPDPSKVELNEEVKLAITYKAAGFETIEYMLINGSYQEYYWPYDGSSQQDANYVIITMVN